MAGPSPDRGHLPPDDQIPSTPEEVAGNALTRRGSTKAVESLGLMPLLLGVAAVLVVALLVFGGEPSPNQLPEPRSQTSTPQK